MGELICGLVNLMQINTDKHRYAYNQLDLVLKHAVLSQGDFSLLNFFGLLNTHKPLYNTLHYNIVLDITQFKDGPQKCIDYIENDHKLSFFCIIYTFLFGYLTCFLLWTPTAMF